MQQSASPDLCPKHPVGGMLACSLGLLDRPALRRIAGMENPAHEEPGGICANHDAWAAGLPDQPGPASMGWRTGSWSAGWYAWSAPGQPGPLIRSAAPVCVRRSSQ